MPKNRQAHSLAKLATFPNAVSLSLTSFILFHFIAKQNAHIDTCTEPKTFDHESKRKQIHQIVR